MLKKILNQTFFVIFIIMFIGCSQSPNPQLVDVLFVWGQKNTNEYCSIWVVDPIQKLSTEIPAQNPCNNIHSLQMNNNLYFFSHHSGELIVYSINYIEGKLEIFKNISLHQIKPSSPPQWDKDGNIYLSGIKNDSEQIYRLSKDTNDLTPIIISDKGFVTYPIMSPSGDFFVYTVSNNLEGKLNCGFLACNVGDYRIFDVKKNEIIELLPLIKESEGAQFIPSHHENAHWSPTGQFLAFQVGTRGIGGIFIIDMHKMVIVSKLKNLSTRDTEIIKWISDTELAYMADQNNSTVLRPYIFSVENNISHEVIRDMPIVNKSGTPYIFYSLDIATTGYLVGNVPNFTDDKKDTSVMLITDITGSYSNSKTVNSSEPLNNTITRWSPFTHPTWSISGDWIAYHSRYKLLENEFEVAEIHITNKNGELQVFNIPLSKLIAPNLQYTWGQIISERN